LSEPPYRVLVIGSHPVQYMSPILRRMAQNSEIELQVAYCSLKGALPSHDPDFNTTVQWDIPLLDGYSWKEIENIGSGRESFLGLWNSGLWSFIRQGRFDAVLCYLGYRCASFWISYFACRLSKTAFIFGTDASSMVPRNGSGWKLRFKKLFWPLLFTLADQVIVPSNATRNLMLSLRIPADRITLTPYSVDNEWWTTKSLEVDRAAIRETWGAAPDTTVVLFCAKLQPWKRPLDLLQAFAQVRIPGSLLIFAGEGVLRAEIEHQAALLGMTEQIRLLGFVNQSLLPAIYTAADLMVLPSEYEPFAVVVNEAFCCGTPVVASDRVGAARDLIATVDPSLVYPCGNVPALAHLLGELLPDRERLRALGRRSRIRMTTWSPTDNIAATLEAVRTALKRLRSP
jgi:glycosyltransferase involved in cell wall biosynthesis